MKVSLECAHCLLERAINQVKLATDDIGVQMEVTAKMLRMLTENFNKDSVPSHIGTERDLLVQRMTGKDPYKELKHLSNSMALSIFPELQSIVDEVSNKKERFRKATLITAAANAIEFDVAGREFSLDELRSVIDEVESDLAIDQIDEFYDLCSNAKEVLYLMDNAGEIVLDMLLIRELRNIGLKVFAVVKGGPVLNDATRKDADEVNLHDYVDEVLDTGAPAIGVNFEKDSAEFIQVLNDAELIIAKGMGNFESMTEFTPLAPTIHIMRTKCMPVANQVGVPRNKNVVLIRYPSE
ncbi:MAG: DUF89 domain-containing protein [Candidatus Thorarchaeota archaeon]